MSDDTLNLIIGAEYLRVGDGMLKAVIQVDERTDAVCYLGGDEYPALSNLCEPFDFKAHIFRLPESALRSAGGLTVSLTCRKKASPYFSNGKGECKSVFIGFDEAAIIPPAATVTRTDRGLTQTGAESGTVAVGVRYDLEFYVTGDGLPVRAYILTADPAHCSFAAGTPFGQLLPDGRVQTVMEEACQVAERGASVLAAFNADFYDMFGDCRPSGLCVSRGTVVANPDSRRPFFGVTREGRPIISTLDVTPVGCLLEAVSGREVLVSDGKVCDTAPLEPFGELPHPRTAVGLCADGTVLFAVIDGRRPSWSNGATLTELSGILISHGAVTALNLDGGGSSTFIVNTPGGLTMLNHPADKIRPAEDLIRPVFDSVVVTAKG